MSHKTDLHLYDHHSKNNTNCPENDCAVKKALDEALANKFLSFQNGEFFDQVSAARMLLGLIRTVNELIKEQAQSAFVNINVSTRNLNIQVNCKEADAMHMKLNSIASDKFEMALGGNPLSLLLPSAAFDLKDLARDVAKELP